MIINNIPLPDILNLSGKKPWEVNLKDTMEMWKFGDFKSFTSLELIAAVFEIPSSKSDISGSDISRVYHREGDLQKIADYCLRDVEVMAKVFKRISGA